LNGFVIDHSLNPILAHWDESHPDLFFGHENSSNSKSLLEENLCRKTFNRLRQFHDLLVKWNQKKQLVAHSTLSSIWSRHILDSVQLFRFRPHHPYRWVDIGTGGGFPGLVLAILANQLNEQDEFFFIEANRFKAEFLKQAVRQLDINAIVYHSRIEQLKSLNADVISARAVVNLPQLLTWTYCHLNQDGYGLFPKGCSVGDEIKQARMNWDFEENEFKSWTHSAGRVVRISCLETKPDAN